MSITYSKDDRVSHPKHGIGVVRSDEEITVIVRFESGLQECPKEELTRLTSIQEAIASTQWDDPKKAIARVQALAIGSVNDFWGAFSLARITLLPHQLWVCHRVVRQLPARWLVADDVGLGKTIEAGLIFWALQSKGAIERVLILCPASLVKQWQYRLRVMFDIRCTEYATELDNAKSDYWNTHPQVIVSLQTLRENTKERHQRLFDADPWDLLIVDEAHHLNAERKHEPTLGYNLVERLVNEYQKVESVVFFTGTPHRGKNYEFFSLLKLLRNDLFDPKKPLEEQLQHLPKVMIRNNKQCVTDMKGKKLFFPPKVTSEIYSYSPEETQFYKKLTKFIETGQAYASGMNNDYRQRAVKLTLTSLQKLASSSVAAIRKALEGRLKKIKDHRQELELTEKEQQRLQGQLDEFEDEETLNSDDINELEERILELTETIRLMEDEEPRLQELVEAAKAITTETKIEKILELVEKEFDDRLVLFFTEYKATQSLLISALIARYGKKCVTFINGDDLAAGVVNSSGEIVTLRDKRETAADNFNQAKVRFLVSTEAAGEGIDLQEKCYSLIHVDLPWNPMRLHQRVGRLNRYGQKRKVEVIMLRNPDTVDTQIWDILNEKTNNVMQSLERVMDEPEDLLQLVLGMTSQKIFREVFSDAPEHKEDLREWFDRKTAKFGDKEAIDAVRALVGNCNKFDFQQVSSSLPQLDLPDLEPFFSTMLRLNKRQVTPTEEGLSFLTPNDWRKKPGVEKNPKGLHFDRQRPANNSTNSLLGVGHKLFNAALSQALDFSDCVSVVPGLLASLFVFTISDRVTGTNSQIQQAVTAVSIDASETATILKDWEIIDLLNQHLPALKKAKESDRRPQLNSDTVNQLLDKAEQFLKENQTELYLPFQIPTVQAIAVLIPSQ